MSYSLLLKLVAIGTLTTSVLTMLLAAGVSATATSSTETQASCDLPTDRTKSSAMRHINSGTLIASSTENKSGYPLLDFSAAESDAAVTLFGCDCPACINALRQLRRESLLNKSQGHCWASLQQRASQQEIQDVLQSLEAEEANQGGL